MALQGMNPAPAWDLPEGGKQGAHVDRQGARVDAVMEDGPAARGRVQEGEHHHGDRGDLPAGSPLRSRGMKRRRSGSRSHPNSVARLLTWSAGSWSPGRPR